MNNFALEIWYDEGSTCTFYTVKWLTDDEEMLSEADKFFNKYAVKENLFQDEAMQLFRLITVSIGDKYGATDDFFDRIEDEAQALPPKPRKNKIEEIRQLGINFPLRLFCYRINEQLVVLFNGGIKTAASAQESEGLRMKFYEAKAFARKISHALQANLVLISENGRYLEGFDNTTEIIF